jgi:L-lactate dehydrogenase complex protein LldG
MSRDYIFHKIRTAVGRSSGQEPAVVPPVRLRVPEMGIEQRISEFFDALEKLAAKTHRASSFSDARDYASGLLAGKNAVASNAPILAECGIASMPSVRAGFTDREELTKVCSMADVGITGADYALADTGTVVMLSSPQEARLVSLLPPVHLAVVAKERILTGLDELFTILPHPSSLTSSMVLITGPSRTADIEQILVRGVHGPGEIHVVVV